MAEHVLMLALSPTMEVGRIVNWHKSEGDSVAQDELLCEVETDKATMEYESASEGTLLKILVPAGGQAKVGEPIAILGEKGEDIGTLIKEAEEGKAPAGEAEGQEPPAAPAPAAAQSAPAVPAAPAAGAAGLKASPLARKLAAEMGVDLRTVQGSGPGGRVVKRDLEKLARAGGASQAVGRPAPGQPAAGAGAKTQPGAQAVLRDERIPVSGKRKVIAERLVKSKFSAPHYYLRMDMAVDALVEARRRLNERLGPESKVSFNAFLLKLVAEALKRHPQVNASWEGDSIFRHGSIDLGLAVAQEDGLITPVVRDCGSKGVLAIDRELAALIDRARNNRLAPEEYTGATFTVSTLGSAGILEFTAIINPPGSAILAVGRIHKAPVVGDDDQIRVQSTMILTLSCDHRVIDGAVGAAFLADLKRMIEDPFEALY